MVQKSDGFYGNIRSRYGQSTVILLKLWVNSLQKIALIRNQKEFLINCRREDLLPKKIATLKLPGICFKSNSINKKFNWFLLNTKRKLLNWMTRDIHNDLKYKEKLLQHLEEKLKNLLPSDILHNFFKFNMIKYDSLLNYHKLKFTKKFNSLLEKENRAKPAFNNNNSWLKNLTNVTIPDSVYFLLSLGEKFNFSYSNKNIPVIQIIKDFETNIYKIPEEKRNEARLELCDLILKVLKKRKHLSAFERRVNKYVRECKTFFKNNNDLIITQADKGNVTVVMYKQEYFEKMEKLLFDENTYSVVHKNPVEVIRRKLNSLLSRWKDLGMIDKQCYKNLFSSDGNLPRAYGLPKIHKINNPLRIIVSSIGSPLYNFARFLQDIIGNQIKTAASYAKNSYDVKSKLQDVIIPHNYKIISLDVNSLFTNVPRDLVIKAIEKRWCDIVKFFESDSLNANFNDVKNEFLYAIDFVMNSTTFKFNDVIYNQKFGTAMGSPVSPILSDLVMQDLETECLSKLDFEIPFFLRYVDDIITAVPNDMIEVVLNTFNSYHERLHFTHEVESNNQISFLDLKLIRNGYKLIFNWYRKPTFSGRYINFLSCHPFSQKVGIIYHLVDKALRLSDKVFYTENLNFIKETLKKNNYPERIVEKFIKKRKNFINNNVNGNHIPNDSADNSKFMVFPFVYELQNPINNLLKKYNLKAAYRTNNKINKKFIRKVKDPLNTKENCNVIYRIDCKNCAASYTGQAVRQLKKRISEHKNNIKRDVCYNNVVSKHILNFKHEFDFENVKILDMETEWKNVISQR